MHSKPKKSLGQNFLIDKNIRNKIIQACALSPGDIVLEIGAGRGELTELIAPRINKLFALELDNNLCKLLNEKFKDYQNVKIINQDILKFDIRKYFVKVKKIKVVGNIPYYISSPIIEHLLKARHKIKAIFITVQKEFAKRMTAQAGSKEYGSFSCFVQYYCLPKKIFHIKKSCFLPSPKVDSSFVCLKILKDNLVSLKDEHLLFRIIRAGFGKRRKTLRNSLHGLVDAQKMDKFFLKFNIDPLVRPERLSLSDFVNLLNLIK
jgi:16S rRNA (adenine1518-N6/adenine1519-N6)-dimethyltransferase